MPRFDEPVPKPRSDFPLHAAANGCWTKKIGGKKRSFGPVRWPDPDEYERSWRAALDEYNRYRDAAKRDHAIVADPFSLDIETLVNGFLTAKHAEAESGAIKPRHFADMRTVLREYRRIVGDAATIAQLESDPKPIEKFVAIMGKRYGFHAFNRAMQHCRSAWNWAADPQSNLLPRPFKWIGLHPTRPLREFRKQRRLARAAGKLSTFGVDEIQAFITHAPPMLRAMVLLGYFAGYGNTDIGEAPENVARIYLKDESFYLHGRIELVPAGWALLDFPRPKTEIDRYALVPAMVVEAIEAVKAMKRPAASRAIRHLLFRTEGGLPFVYDTIRRDEDGLILTTNPTDNVKQKFKLLVSSIGRCARHGLVQRKPFVRGKRLLCPTCQRELEPIQQRGFYCLRHTATTIAAASGASSDTRDLFEGHGSASVRKEFYLDPDKLHDLLLIARNLLSRLIGTIELPSTFGASDDGRQAGPTARAAAG